MAFGDVVRYHFVACGVAPLGAAGLGGCVDDDDTGHKADQGEKPAGSVVAKEGESAQEANEKTESAHDSDTIRATALLKDAARASACQSMGGVDKVEGGEGQQGYFASGFQGVLCQLLKAAPAALPQRGISPAGLFSS